MEIFIADIPHFLDKFHDCSNCLGDNEKKYIKNIISPKAKNQFVASKMITRSILSQKLNVSEKELEFLINENGKPYLAGTPIHFNVSHSKDIIVVAIDDEEMGIDVEYMKDRDFISLAQNKFAQASLEKILKSNNPKEEFYLQWTLYEASVKKNGGSVFSNFAPKINYHHSQCIGNYMISVVSNKDFISELKLNIL